MVDIYIITNIINGKEYIGITKRGYLKRFKDHLRCAYSKDLSRSGYVLYRAIRKHDKVNFKVELLEQVETYHEAKIKEIEYISKFKTYYKDDINWGYNMTRGGDGRGFSYVNEKQREKLREISLNLHKDKNFRDKFLKAMRSPKVRKSISMANMGSKNGMYGNGHLVSGEKNYWYGRFGESSANFGNKYSDETKEKIRKNTLYHWENNEEFINNNLNHLKELGQRQIGVNNPATKRTYLYDSNKALIGIFTMKDVGKLIGCCQSTLRKYKDSNIEYENYYIYSNPIQHLEE